VEKMRTIAQPKIFRDFSTSDRPQTSKTDQDHQRVKTPRTFHTASVDLPLSPQRQRMSAICAHRTASVDVDQTLQVAGTELSPILGDGLMDQAAAIWD
jgi:hypothetical protein